MRLNSLALRLFVSATTWTVVILRRHRHRALLALSRGGRARLRPRLGVYLRTLVADVAMPEENAGKFPQSMGEPLFDLPLSGWYWQVTRLDAPTPDVRASRSLWDATLPRLADLGASSAPGGRAQGYVEGPEDQELRIVERTIDLGEDGRYLVAVAGDADEIDEEIARFDGALVVDLRRAGDRAAADHHLPDPLRPRAAQAHLRGPCRDPLGRGGAARRRLPGRDRAARARDQRADRRQPRDRRRARAPRSATSRMR